MIDKGEFVKVIETVAPPYLAAEWDNSGMQIEPAGRDIGRVLIALELTPDVVSEAKAGGYDLILTHHPMFFGGDGSAKERNIVQSSTEGRYILRLLTEPPQPVGVYAAHTSFDAADEGLNDELQRLIGLTPWDDRLHPDIAAEFSQVVPFTRTGRFPEPVDLAGAFACVKAALGTGVDIRVNGDHTKNVLKIMTACGGGGGEVISLAVKTGCSLLITGDVRHHEWRMAEAEGLAVIDAGHYYTERPFAALIARRLSEELGQAYANVVIDVSAEIRQPYASPVHAI